MLAELLAYSSSSPGEEAEKALVNHIWPPPKKEPESRTLPLPFAKNWKKTAKKMAKTVDIGGWHTYSTPGPLQRWLKGCINSVPHEDVFELIGMNFLGNMWRGLAHSTLESLEGDDAPSSQESAAHLRTILGKRRLGPELALEALRKGNLLDRVLDDFIGEDGYIIYPLPAATAP